MASDSILGNHKLIAFVHVTDPGRARAFYEGVLGLRLVQDEKPFALVFDANGIMLRVTPVAEFEPSGSTVLGWAVDSIDETVKRLQQPGWSLIAIRG
jgi:catechol 2,3-dioxygenase-like lactoylglutathione lyase family enzyme